MRKTLFLMICLFGCISLMGCNKTVEKTCEEDPNQDKCVKEEEFDFQGKEFVIMVNNPLFADPFSESYEGLYQREKQENQTRNQESSNRGSITEGAPQCHMYYTANVYLHYVLDLWF